MRTIIQRATLITTVSLVLSGFSSASSAQTRTPIDVASLGPQIGEQAPDFSLPDQNGQLHTLDSIRGLSGTMLLFHRSADW